MVVSTHHELFVGIKNGDIEAALEGSAELPEPTRRVLQQIFEAG